LALLAEGNEMKTDNELNRLIAERVMGKAPDKNESQWRGVLAGVALSEYSYPDYCTDPAAWGALLEWLHERDYYPELGSGPQWRASLHRVLPTSGKTAYAATPGRALVLATLAAYGVEVE
jgi:hypothetical protein